MRKWLLIIVVLAVGFAFLMSRLVHAQNGNIVYIAPDTGTTVTNCGTPTSGFPLCGVATGWFTWNGTAWVQLGTAPAPAGVTSVTICNASGTSCGTAQIGPVTLNVPKSVTITAGTATLQ